MKLLSIVLLSLPLVASNVITFEPNEGLEHFKSIVVNFGKILSNEKNSEKLQEAVTQMIESTISLIATAKDKGLCITKDECDKIFKDLDIKMHQEITRALNNNLNEDDVKSKPSECDKDGCCDITRRHKCCCVTTTTNGTTTTTCTNKYGSKTCTGSTCTCPCKCSCKSETVDSDSKDTKDCNKDCECDCAIKTEEKK